MHVFITINDIYISVQKKRLAFYPNIPSPIVYPYTESNINIFGGYIDKCNNTKNKTHNNKNKNIL